MGTTTSSSEYFKNIKVEVKSCSQSPCMLLRDNPQYYFMCNSVVQCIQDLRNHVINVGLYETNPTLRLGISTRGGFVHGDEVWREVISFQTHCAMLEHVHRNLGEAVEQRQERIRQKRRILQDVLQRTGNDKRLDTMITDFLWSSKCKSPV